MFIGIVSYLPQDENLRLKRKQCHEKQLDLLTNYNLSINIVAQAYRNEDYINKNNVNYLYKLESGIGPAKARNLLLQSFYNSNEDFMLMCDDDIYFYNYYDINNFINEIHTNPQKFIQLDYIRGVFASKRPFKKTVYEQPKNLTDYVFKDEASIDTTCLAIIKNFKKYYGKEIYYNDMDVSMGGGYEDRDFCCQLKLNGIKTHVLQTFIIASYNYTDNSTLFKDMDDRLKHHESNSNSILDKYKDTNLFEDGKLSSYYRNTPIAIPRSRPMVIEENLIPEYKNKAGGCLFKI